MGRTAWTSVVVLVAACNGGAGPGSGTTGTTGTTGGSDGAQWTEVIGAAEGALLSVWAGEDRVYAVGGAPAQAPHVFRLADGSWDELDTGATGTLWWVAPDPDGNLWMVGEGGLALRHDLATDSFVTVDLTTSHTLFGIWFEPGGQGWAVGADFLADTGRGVVLTGQGDTWQVDDTVPADQISADGLFKVWGLAADDVWIVGESGLVLHRDADGWAQVPNDVDRRLLTVHGFAGLGPFMVGGGAGGTLLEARDGTIVDRSDEVGDLMFTPLNGVFAAAADRAFAVGNNGLFLTWGGPAEPWAVGPRPNTGAGLHAVVEDSSGDLWAVGGNLISLGDGVLFHRGSDPPPRDGLP